MTVSAHFDLQVPFYEVDSAHMAWHGHFAKYFELARCRLLEAIGHDYEAMFECGYAWPVVDMRIRYMRPLRFKQHVRVAATLQRWDHQMRVTYRIRDRDSGGSLARGFTQHAPIDLATGELYLGQPPEVARVLALAGIEPPDNQALP